MGRDLLGEFEHQVLLTILRLGDEAYTAPIVLELEERTGRRTTLAAVYIVLCRLEKKGVVRSRVRGEVGEGGVRDRRYFRVTRLGVKRVREARIAYDRLWDGLEGICGL